MFKTRSIQRFGRVCSRSLDSARVSGAARRSYSLGKHLNKSSLRVVSSRNIILSSTLLMGMATLINTASADGVKVPSIEPVDAARITEDRYTSSAIVSEIVEKMKGKSIDDLKVRIYQYQVCPFCCKVRAFLDFHKIPYEIVEVNPMSKAEIKGFDYKKVPVVVCNGVQLNDSSVIITTLAEVMNQLHHQSSYQFSEEEAVWRRFVDEIFVRRIPPNIYRSYGEAKAAFEYISERNEFTWLQKSFAIYGGSVAMWGVSKKLKQKYEIGDEREAIYAAANDWMAAVGDKQFLGGATPNLADLGVYGILSSIEGLSTFNDLCHETSIGEFYYRMKKEVGQPSGTKVEL